MLLYILQKYYFDVNHIFCQDLLMYISSGPHTKCHPHLTSSCVLHVDTTDYKNLKTHGVGIDSKGIMVMPSVKKNWSTVSYASDLIFRIFSPLLA
jgi:hypothetical protein